MKKFSIVLCACFFTCIQLSAQCGQNIVQIHCYNSLGDSLFIRDDMGVVLLDTTISAYTVSNNFILELNLATGCYTIQLTNDSNFTTYLYGVDSNGTAQYVWFSAGTAPQFPFSVDGTGGCNDPAAVNYIPGACTIPGNNTVCNYEPNAHFLTMELCETLNGDKDEIIFSIFRACDGASFGFSSLNIDGGHTIHQYVLYEGDYLIDFSDYGVPVVFNYVLRLDGIEIASGSTLDDFEFTVGTGSVYGCADSNAINFDPLAECNDGSCEYSSTCPVGNPCLFEVEFLNAANTNEYACFTFYDETFSVVVEGCVYESLGDSTYIFCIETGCYFNFSIDGYGSYNWQLYDGNSALAESGNDGTFLYNFCIDAGTNVPAECNDPAACNYDSNATNNLGCNYAAINLISVTDEDGTIESMSYTIINTITMEVEFTGTLVEGTGISLCHDLSQYTIEITPLVGYMDWQMEPVTLGTLTGNSAFGNSFYTTDGTHLLGCTHSLALNFINWASQDDGSCIFPIPGCMDSQFCNYNPLANVDDGNCMNGDNLFQLQFIDLGADGFEGAHYFISDSLGNVLAQGTYNGIASTYGDPYITYFCLPDGCYRFSIGGGMDDGEIIWQFLNINNDNFNIYSGGGAYLDYDFFLGEIPQPTGLYIEMFEIGSGQFDGATWTLFRDGNFAAFAITWATTGYHLWFECLPLPGCYQIEFASGTSPDEDVIWKIYGTDQGVINDTGSNSAYFTIGGGFGCTDIGAYNYSPIANCDDGSCVYDQTGDFNLDGAVNTSDLLLFMGSYGCNIGCGPEDLNLDGAINTIDLLVFLGVFGI